MNRRKITLRALVLAAAGLLAMLAGTGAMANAAAVSTTHATASAGAVAPGVVTPNTTYTNYEVSVYTYYSDQIQVCGYNQHGSYVCSPWTNSPNPWTLISGWWWHGTVTITGFQISADKYRYLNCVLPSSSTSNIQYCSNGSGL